MPDPRHLAGVVTRWAALLIELAQDDPGLAAAAAFLEAMAAAPPEDPPGLAPLAAGLGLSAQAVDVVALAGLPEAHEGYADVLRRLHPQRAPRPTVALASRLLGADPRALLSGPLVDRRVLLIGDEAQPIPERSLRLSEGLWPALHGAGRWPLPLESARRIRAGLDAWAQTPAARRVVTALGRQEAALIHLTATRPAAALARALVLADEAGVTAVPLRWEGASADDAAAVALRALVTGAVPVIAYTPAPGAAPTAAPDIDVPGRPVILCTTPGVPPAATSRPVLSLAIERLRPQARVTMWEAVLPELAADAGLLAARYPLEPSMAAAAAVDARERALLEARPTTLEDVAHGVRQRSTAGGTAAAQRIRPQATWDRLVLPDDTHAQLREAVDRLHGQVDVLDRWGFAPGQRGAFGVRLLLAGPPGTGKTLAAEVLASAVGADLLQVDLSQVVSKWIGETEKNLSAVFDAAEHSTAVLFFDEADALFGRRTEVRDAHDRYANLETAYLLMRLERFEGLAVLATNLQRNIDNAFLRRLDFLVEFGEPDRALRERIWRLHVPEAAPVDSDVDFGRLARRYPVTGAIIRNAALAAAFLAAAEGSPIRTHHLDHAMRREYAKAGRAFPGT